MNPLNHTKAFLQNLCEHTEVSMNLSDSLQALLSQGDLAESLAADRTFQECYGAVEAVARYNEKPQSLHGDDCSTSRVLDIIRNCRCGYAFLEFTEPLLVESLPKDGYIGDRIISSSSISRQIRPAGWTWSPQLQLLVKLVKSEGSWKAFYELCTRM